MNWDTSDNNRFIDAVLSLRTREEARRFLRDLMTEGEIVEMAKRLKAATMLTNKLPYSAIEKETGFSSTTVARVAKWLNTGKGGYSLVINRSHHNLKSD